MMTEPFDPVAMLEALDTRGYALLKGLASEQDCRDLAGRFDQDRGFRSQVIMQHHGYGHGTYKYFSYPLPGRVAELRRSLYAPLAALANIWHERLGVPDRFPDEHADYLEICRQAGQVRPTPLLLRYETGDHNRLHQDLYGALVFPLQATFLLSDPARDFTGGEFVLTEQRPRQQSRVEVVPLSVGDCVIFPVQTRPVAGKRGFYRATMRHGVSRLHSGTRTTLGLIFHDAL